MDRRALFNRTVRVSSPRFTQASLRPTASCGIAEANPHLGLSLGIILGSIARLPCPACSVVAAVLAQHAVSRACLPWELIFLGLL